MKDNYSMHDSKLTGFLSMHGGKAPKTGRDIKNHSSAPLPNVSRTVGQSAETDFCEPVRR